jgi:hypothetical protein
MRASPSTLLAALLLAGALAGCGAGNRQSAATRSAAADAAHPGAAARSGAAVAPYRWLVNTTGPQPSVATENAEPGTRAWRLPGPPAEVGGLRSGDVAGYVSEETVDPGQTERIYVSAPRARSVEIRVFRIGWYGGTGGREVLVSRRLRVVPQPPCVHRSATGLTECNWRSTLSFTIPPALPSGVYIARLSARAGQSDAPLGQSDALFVVRATVLEPLLAQLPTSTYEAYNAWGGNSLYPGGGDPVAETGTTQGIEVSSDRPYDSDTGAGQLFARDVAMVQFLERYGYPVSYTTSESIDGDPAQALGHRALIDFGHSEYWSQRQADAFARARDAGVSLLFFGSDTMAWRVRYAPASGAPSEAAQPTASAAGQPPHLLVSYKEHAGLDPDRANPTGPFPAGGAPLTGSAYVGCITPRVSRPGAPTYRYYSWSPAPELRPSWLFAGTGITAATQIPGMVGYELDLRAAESPAGTQVVGSGTATCMPAAAGEPAPGPGQDLAQTTLYTARSGAIVFGSGTLGWELGLEPVPSASPDAPTQPDPRVVEMTRNLLAHVLEMR